MSSVQELHHGVLSVHQIILVSLVLANEHNEDLHSASALLLNHFLPHLQIKVAMSVDCAFKLLLFVWSSHHSAIFGGKAQQTSYSIVISY